jgi:hypothetical protein
VAKDTIEIIDNRLENISAYLRLPIKFIVLVMFGFYEKERINPSGFKA